MNIRSRTIQVDAETAEALEARAAERGVSVAELVAELAAQSAPVSADPDEIAELDRRWSKVKAGGAVPGERVVRWLESWGTPEFKAFKAK